MSGVDVLTAGGAILYLVLSLVPFWVVARSEHKGLVRPLIFFVVVTAIYYVVPMGLAFTDGTASSSVAPVLLVGTANLLFLAGYKALPIFVHGAERMWTLVPKRVGGVHTRLPKVNSAIVMGSYLVIAVIAGVVFYAGVGGLGYLCHLNLTTAATAGTT